MKTAIYKGSKKYDSYLYVEREGDFSRVPEVLLKALGKLELVMTLELGADRKLARVDVALVMKGLENEGFFLQMPDESEKLALASSKPVSNPIPKL